MKDPVTKLIFVFLLFWFFVLGCAAIFSSCHVLKKSYKQTSDSTHLQKVDSGKVVERGGESKSESDWWRNTILYPQPVFRPGEKDTISLQPQYITQPIAVIHEGGTNKQEDNWYERELAWQRRVDSLNAKLNVVNTSTKRDTFSFWQLIGIALVGSVGLAIIQGITKFKIVKR